MNDVKPTDLIHDDHNLNRGTEAGRELLPKIIEKLGFGRSVLVDKDGRLIAGNKATDAAIEAGITKTIVVESDGDAIIVHKRTDLSLDDPEGRELAAADNRSSEIGLAWDPDELQYLQTAGVDLSDLWDEEQMKALIKQVSDAVQQPPPAEFQEHTADGLLTSLYYETKAANGYSEEQIAQKRVSLEGVLVPITAKWNEEMLSAAGFRHVECFWRNLNFAGWVAIKE